jgi:thymidine kinase
MAKLYFHYGAMGSSKTANALMVHYNYIERGKNALLVKSEVDKRDGDLIMRSRIGLNHECITLDTLINSMSSEYLKNNYDCIIVDEIQFATPEQIDYLSDIVDFLDIPVMCYGLRADFQNKLFPGSERLLAIADSIKEIKTVCWCGKKATCNARYTENGIVREGEQVVIGANDKYTALCRKHFKEGNLG